MAVLAADYPTTEVPTAPVITPEAWKGADLATSGEWLYRISAAAQEELHAALRHVTDSGLAVPFFTREDFPLSGFAAELDGIRNELEGGRGFVVMRGIDRTRYSKRQCADIFWGIGTHLGTAVPQNGDGHLLGHIRDHGYSFDDPTVRGYQTSAELSFHTDMCDVVFLLCLNTAKRGGLNRFVSTVSIHNEILERGAQVEQRVVVYQHEIAGFLRHVDMHVGPRGDFVEQVERFGLGFGQARDIREPLRGLDVEAEIAAGDVAVEMAEDRHHVIGRAAVVVELAAAVEIERLV